MSDKKLAIDMTPEELEQWIDSLETEDDSIRNFIFTIPILISKSHPLPSRSPGISGSVRTDTSM